MNLKSKVVINAIGAWTMLLFWVALFHVAIGDMKDPVRLIASGLLFLILLIPVKRFVHRMTYERELDKYSYNSAVLSDVHAIIVEKFIFHLDDVDTSSKFNAHLVRFFMKHHELHMRLCLSRHLGEIAYGMCLRKVVETYPDLEWANADLKSYSSRLDFADNILQFRLDDLFSGKLIYKGKTNHA